MAPVARRIAPPAQRGGSIDFGSDGFYSGGLGLPEGKYSVSFHTQMFQPTKANGTPAGAAFLCVMMTCYPLQGGDKAEHPLGCGQKAHLSFVPSADGLGFDSVPGGPGVGMNDQTNWSIFRTSMRNCGLPEGILKNDVSVLNGMWIQTQNVPEPESRKQMRSQTGEAALNADPNTNRVRTCVVVAEILDNGKPWEGTGGLPENEGDALLDAAPKPAVRRAIAPAAAAPAARVAPPAAAPEPAETEVSVEDIATAAMTGCTEFLTNPKYARGCTKVQLRTGCFTAVSKSQGEDMANAVLETYFGSDDTLNVILGELGYVSTGSNITVALQ